jgi:hypothetical protein
VAETALSVFRTGFGRLQIACSNVGYATQRAPVLSHNGSSSINLAKILVDGARDVGSW